MNDDRSRTKAFEDSFSGRAHDSAEDSFPLFERFQKGDRQAGERLYQLYEDRLLRYVRIQLGAQARRQADTMDIVQGVYADFLPRVEEVQYRGRGSVLAYLKKTAHNMIRNLANRWRPPEEEAAPEQSGFWLGVEQNAEPSPTDELNRRELAAILDEAASRLPDHQREVLLQRFLFQASWDDITREMGFPSVDAAYMAYQRAKLRWLELAEPRLRPWMRK